MLKHRTLTMRWLFADPNQPDEAAHVRERIASIDRWWQSFQAQQTNIEKLFKRKSDWNLPQFMEDTLQAIDPRLMWEYGPAVRQSGHRLVITPESQRWLRPMVRTLLEKSPKIAGWEFYPYRLPEAIEQTVQTVKGRVGVDVSGALIDASVAPGRKVDLQYAFPRKKKFDHETAMQAAFVTTETLLGEQMLDTWVGSMGVMEDEYASSGHPLPLDRAQATVAALIRGMLDQLLAKRLQDMPQPEKGAVLKLEPPEDADDYPARTDLIVAFTPHVELFQAIHSGQSFASACHSKWGEVFCYLKLDAIELPKEDIVGFRSTIEDALEPALRTAGVGCTIGGGSGLRYAYIDLSLSDMKRATPIIRQILAEHQAPIRSWLLFHDDDMAAEWIAVYSQTPPPP
jgi:hypothetical protein